MVLAFHVAFGTYSSRSFIPGVISSSARHHSATVKQSTEQSRSVGSTQPQAQPATKCSRSLMTPIILASRLCLSCATATKKCDVLITVSSHYCSCCRCRCTPDDFPTTKMLRRIHRHGVTAAPAAVAPRRRCSPAASPRGGPQLAQQRVAVGAVSPRFRPLLRVHPPQRLQLLVRLLVQLQKGNISIGTHGWMGNQAR